MTKHAGVNVQEANPPKLNELIGALVGKSGIADVIPQDDNTYLITTIWFYQDGDPVRVRIRTSADSGDQGLMTDCGDTIAHLNALGVAQNLEDRVRDYLKLWSAQDVRLLEDELTVKVAADSLHYAVTILAQACASLVMLEKTMADFQRSQEEQEKRARDEREAKSFSLRTREEIVAFEERLYEFSSRERLGHTGQISLIDVYDVLASREDRQQIITALLDLVVSHCMLRLDVRDALSIWKEFFGEGGLASGSILDSAMAFSLRMHIHRFNSSFVFRYRALWDKLMGVYVLIFEPRSYDGFQRAKSKKRVFSKLSSRPGSQLSAFAQGILDLLTTFDDNYRTPEAHHTGKIRKWTLIIEPYEESPQHELNMFWRYLDGALERLGDIFRGVERVQLASVRETELWLQSNAPEYALRPAFQSVLSALSFAIPQLARNHAKELVVLVVYGTGYVRSARYWLYNRNREAFVRMMDHDYKEILSTVDSLPEEVKPLGQSVVKALGDLKIAIEEQ